MQISWAHIGSILSALSVGAFFLGAIWFKLDSIDNRLNRMEISIDSRLNRMETKMDTFLERVVKLESR